jgi:hypothetical protein
MYSHVDVNTSIREKAAPVKGENAVRTFEGEEGHGFGIKTRTIGCHE